MQKQCCQSVNYFSNIYFYHIEINGVNHKGLVYRYLFSNVRHLPKGIIYSKRAAFPLAHLAADYSVAPLAEPRIERARRDGPDGLNGHRKSFCYNQPD